MKKLILFALVPSIVFFSCKKDTTSQAGTTPQYMADFLTTDSLKFDSYIFKWNTSKADTFYKRGSIANRVDMDTCWFKFNTDGTYKAHMPLNYNYSAQWQFLQNGTKLRLWSSGFDKQYTLIKLSKDTVEWLDPGLDSLFYRLVHK